jgi:hypothetical protein
MVVETETNARPLHWRDVLIVSPNFPPINAPDHQRIRTSLPYLDQYGWRAAVLAVCPSFVEASTDAELLRTVPPGTNVYWTKALPAGLTAASASEVWA